MDILFLTVGTAQTGTYFRSHNLARALEKRKHKVTVITSSADSQERERELLQDGIKYRVIPGNQGQRWFGWTNRPLTAIRRAVTDYPHFDVVHMFQPFLTTYSAWRSRFPKSQRWFDWDDLWSGGGLLDRTPRRGMRAAWDYR